MVWKRGVCKYMSSWVIVGCCAKRETQIRKETEMNEQEQVRDNSDRREGVSDRCEMRYKGTKGQKTVDGVEIHCGWIDGGDSNRCFYSGGVEGFWWS